MRETGRTGEPTGMPPDAKKEAAERFYQALLEDAFRYIDSLGGEVSMVSGPLRVDSPEFKQNLVALEKQIGTIEAGEEKVFNQSAYIDKFIMNAPRDTEALLETFYKGLIQSGKIKKLYVMPGAGESRGMKSEIEYAEAAGIPVIML